MNKTFDDFWVIVWDNGKPIPPFDCNPNHEDQGMLVFESEQAATQAAEYQANMYGGGDEGAKAIRLSEYANKASP